MIALDIQMEEIYVPTTCAGIFLGYAIISFQAADVAIAVADQLNSHGFFIAQAHVGPMLPDHLQYFPPGAQGNIASGPSLTAQGNSTAGGPSTGVQGHFTTEGTSATISPELLLEQSYEALGRLIIRATFREDTPAIVATTTPERSRKLLVTQIPLQLDGPSFHKLVDALTPR